MIRVDVSGLKELERKLAAVGDDALKIMRKAGRSALEPVLSDMKAHAGYNPKGKGPHMRDDIKIRSTSRLNDPRYLTVITFKVGPSKAHHIKALAQEFGTVKQVAEPFMRPALDYNKSKVLRILAAELRYGLENRNR
ncbi:hypothetical protein SME38J_05050 [Serratia marcescens]|nr:hypothetical protein SME38J_05050 [Serratia marcescens]